MNRQVIDHKIFDTNHDNKCIKRPSEAPAISNLIDCASKRPQSHARGSVTTKYLLIIMAILETKNYKAPILEIINQFLY